MQTISDITGPNSQFPLKNAPKIAQNRHQRRNQTVSMRIITKTREIDRGISDFTTCSLSATRAWISWKISRALFSAIESWSDLDKELSLREREGGGEGLGPLRVSFPALFNVAASALRKGAIELPRGPRGGFEVLSLVLRGLTGPGSNL